MPLNVACVVIASEKRLELLDTQVLPSVLVAPFLEVVVVGDYHEGAGYRYLPVPPLTATTTDALVKRDVGTLATTAPWIFYLCDDHALRGWSEPPTKPQVIGVPLRYSTDAEGTVHLCNAGLDERDPYAPYIGGHAGLFSRHLIMQRPWSAMPHHRNWDLIISRIHVAMGARLEPSTWRVEDLEPEARPWG